MPERVTRHVEGDLSPDHHTNYFVNLFASKLAAPSLKPKSSTIFTFAAARAYDSIHSPQPMHTV
jgi:hypothetical protein